MKILLDECLPRKLKSYFHEHEVVTVPERGWAGTKNGTLLKLAGPEFDVFVTLDKGLPYQQNLNILQLRNCRILSQKPQFEAT